MRRTITLLVLLLCCVPRAGAQTAVGQSPAAEAARVEYSNAVKKLSQVANERNSMQEGGAAKALNNEIVKRLGSLFPSEEDFTSDAKLKEVAPNLATWKETANDPSKRIPRRALVAAIEEADRASSAYAAALKGDSSGGTGGKEEDAATPTTTPAKPLTVQVLADEVVSLKKQVNEQKGILPWWASLGLMTLTPLLTLGLFAFAFVSIRQTRRDVADLKNQAHQAFLSLRTKHDALSKKLEGLSATDADLFTRLAELSAEIGAVDGRMRGLKTAAVKTHPDGDGLGLPPLPQPELPAFPVAAAAYLRKMQRHATVVKPDFQNGILIADPENKGELVLVQDTSVSHDTLFVVPRAAQFQMKQDFYTYYERYYECDRPASGTVWIVDPAVVERVQGGWELREKGVLEVR